MSPLAPMVTLEASGRTVAPRSAIFAFLIAVKTRPPLTASAIADLAAVFAVITVASAGEGVGKLSLSVIAATIASTIEQTRKSGSCVSQVMAAFTMFMFF
ncbi:MAG: hypothetical protein M3Y27_23170 [Acidobacteriota bacterium]|nr:hypothetical protein [Acidobacteriota bacterium]